MKIEWESNHQAILDTNHYIGNVYSLEVHEKTYRILIAEYGRIIRRELKKKPQTLSALMKDGKNYQQFLSGELDFVLQEIGDFPEGLSFFETLYKENVDDGKFEDMTAKNMLLMYRHRIQNIRTHSSPEDDQRLLDSIERLFIILSKTPDDIRVFNLQEKFVRREIIKSIIMSKESRKFKSDAVSLVERQSLQIINLINDLSIKHFTNTLLEEQKLKEAILLQQKVVEDELKNARKIQQNLLPKSFPFNSHLKIFTRYIPMASVGGDFYDITRIPASSENNNLEQIALLISDVSGHGIPAAFIASMTKISWQSAIEKHSSPSEILKRINHQLNGLTSGKFLTGLVGIFEPNVDPNRLETGTFRFSNGAHFPPYIIRKSGEPEIPELKGQLLGVFPQIKVSEKSLYYYRGDRFIFFTDGLVEARTLVSRELLSEERLFEIFQETKSMDGESACEYILKKIEKFTDCKIFEDDITLIIVDIV